MPVCKCSQKLGRRRGNLQFTICKQCYHFECCNSTKADPKFAINLRYSSCERTPPPFCLTLSLSSDVSLNCTQALNELLLSLADVHNADDAAVTDDVAKKVSGRNGDCVLSDADDTADGAAEQSHISLRKMIFSLHAEVVLLRKSNKKLTDLVFSLLDRINDPEKVNPPKQKNRANKQNKNSGLSVTLNVAQRNVVEDAPKAIDSISKPDANKPSVSHPHLSTYAAGDSNSQQGSDVVSKSLPVLSYAAALQPLDATPVAPSRGVAPNFKVVDYRRKKNVGVVGDNANSEMDVFTKLKLLHISSFKNSVTAADIKSYIYMSCLTE